MQAAAAAATEGEQTSSVPKKQRVAVVGEEAVESTEGLPEEI